MNNVPLYFKQQFMKVGNKVSHHTFGVGTIIQISALHDENTIACICVQFHDADEKYKRFNSENSNKPLWDCNGLVINSCGRFFSDSYENSCIDDICSSLKCITVIEHKTMYELFYEILEQ